MQPNGKRWGAIGEFRRRGCGGRVAFREGQPLGAGSKATTFPVMPMSAVPFAAGPSAVSSPPETEFDSRRGSLRVLKASQLFASSSTASVRSPTTTSHPQPINEMIIVADDLEFTLSKVALDDGERRLVSMFRFGRSRRPVNEDDVAAPRRSDRNVWSSINFGS